MVGVKDEKLKAFVRSKTREILLKTGRKLVADGGVDALSARKLALEANSSVGMIYNLFGTMENYVLEQNVLTLTELYQKMKQVVLGKNHFNNLNRYMDVLTVYIEANQNLWYLLYSNHLTTGARQSSVAEARVVKKIDVLIATEAAKLAKGIKGKEKRLAIKVLEMSLFALSGYLLGSKLNPKSGLNRGNLCKLLMNTYMAGLVSLGQGAKND